MKKLIEFLGTLLFVSLLIACPLLCGLAFAYRWNNYIIGVWLLALLIGEFMFLWVIIEDKIKGKKE